MESRLLQFQTENLSWQQNHVEEVRLSKTKQEAYFFIDPEKDACGSSGVHSEVGFTEGEHYWEITFLEALYGQSVMLGVATEGADLASQTETNLLGANSCSWGLSYKGTLHHAGSKRVYCDPFFAANTTIGVHLDLQKGTLCFYRNGNILGSPITGLDRISARFFPVVSSSSQAEVAIGRGLRRQTSLFEKCCVSIKRNCSAVDVQSLPLPKMLKADFSAE